MSKSKANTMKEVFSGSSIDVEIVSSMLRDSEIEAFVKDNFMGSIAPWQVSAGGAGAVKIVVSAEDYEKARFVIEEYYKNSDNTVC